jgi:hypothetical protein
LNLRGKNDDDDDDDDDNNNNNNNNNVEYIMRSLVIFILHVVLLR